MTRLKPTRLLTIVTLFALAVDANQADAGSPDAVEFRVGNDEECGIPLMDFPNEMVILGRDGQIHSLKGKARESVRKATEPYSPASTIEMRNRLRTEFGADFEVLTTNHFLVVQPRGRGNRWANLFERSHRAFVQYMSVRGVRIRRGRFPMVAIVMPDSAAMYREMDRMNVRASRVAGIYLRESNRVITHDGGHLAFIAATVRHEAAHQSAYNYNVHSRVVITPRWVSEGIGQLFEPETMVSTRSGLKARDRANQDSLGILRKRFGKAQDPAFANAVKDLVGSDSMFDTAATTSDAYAVAWAMMFYLAEREPKLFAKVLDGTNRRGVYQPYDRIARLKDFERWTGTSIDEFAQRVAWYMKSLY